MAGDLLTNIPIDLMEEYLCLLKNDSKKDQLDHRKYLTVLFEMTDLLIATEHEITEHGPKYINIKGRQVHTDLMV